MSSSTFPGIACDGAKLDEENDSVSISDPSTFLAPVEKVNPLRREVTLLSAIMLDIGQITGSGIYAVPGVILNSVGSVGLLFVFWILAPIFAFAGLMLYGELASMFPRRSGAEVVYLEQAFPRPKYFVSTAFAITTILLSFSATNAIVFAQYVLTAIDIPITASSQTTVALSVLTFSVGTVGLSTRWSLWAVNVITVVKIISLGFVVVTGIAVLAGLTRITDPFTNFHNLFEGSTSNPNSLATSLVKANHAFIGWHNAFNVLGEIKGSNPVRTVRKAGFISLSVVSVLFLFTNIAYVAVIPREEIRNSGQLIAALFFRRVFGHSLGSKLLPIVVASSCVGNIIAVTVGQARIIREVARQGLLPYPSFFASTKPFGTPLGPVALKYFLTAFVLVAVPAQDAFQFLIDLASYPHLVFQCAMVAGVWILRKRRALAHIPPSVFQAWNSVVTLYLLSCVFLLVMPWVPPEPGQADVSFWYATYCVVGTVLLLLCGLYYWLWIIVLPKIGGYEIVTEVEELADGARNTRLVRRYHSLPGEEEPLLDH